MQSQHQSRIPLELSRISSDHEVDTETCSDPLLDGARSELDDQIVRKLDLILLPFLSLLFLFNSMDRSNIGNAETAGFTHDVGLEPHDLNSAVALFFAIFVALQPLGAFLGRRFGMAIWVPSCMFLWGACTTGHVWIRQRWHLMVLRAIIGMLEAGFYPTTVSYLSLFYTRYEFARRLSIFYGQYAISGAVGGILSYVCFSRFPSDSSDTTSRFRPWQILFLVQGLATMLLAFFGVFYLPHSARTAWFFNETEGNRAEHRIRQDRMAANLPCAIPVSSDHTEEIPSDNLDEGQLLLSSSSIVQVMESKGKSLTIHHGLSSRDVVEAVLDWKLWHLLFCNIFSAFPVVTFSIFLPLVLQPLSDTPAYVNLLTVPPYIAGATTLYVFATWSDNSHQRLVPILWSLLPVVIGLMGMVFIPEAFFICRYIALCVLLSGAFVASPLVIAWFTTNVPEAGKRSAMLGINGWGNLTGVLSPLIFQPRYAPFYTTPLLITLIFVLLACIGFASFRILIKAENERRQALLAQWESYEIRNEDKHGKGPFLFKSYPWLIELVRIFGGRNSSQRLKRCIVLDSRRGDDRITFQYEL